MNNVNLIVGAGLSGAVAAERLAAIGEKSLVIDRRQHVAGNCYDYLDHGIHVHLYGPHVFHTNSERVWAYLSGFTRWHLYMHRVRAVIEGREAGLPFNLDSLHQMFPASLAVRLQEKLLAAFAYNTAVPILELRKTTDTDLNFLADYIYRNVFLGYTIKQWGLTPEELDPSVSSRIPILISRDSRYFQDKYQAVPAEGYTAMIKKMLDHELIEVRLETDVKNLDWRAYKRLFYTGPIDEFFERKHGGLPYRSLHFDFVAYERENFQSVAQMNYPNNYDFTRITEYKKFLDEKSPDTVVSYEYSKEYTPGINEPYYPVPDTGGKNAQLCELYRREADLLDNVQFFGRLGDYKYYNMDQTVARALELMDKVLR